ncbi:MAG: tyrosine-type recombinase/integrase [Pseudomonadota bacterium]
MKKKLLEFDASHNATVNNPTIEAFNKLRKADRLILNDFERYCQISANSVRAKKYKTNVLRFLLMAEKKADDINLEDLREFLVILKKSDFSDYYKNDTKGYIQRFLKWHFKDWSERFDNFDDIKYNSDAQRKVPITDKDIPTKEEVEMLVKEESFIYWKTFLISQYEGALRTLECRKMKWDDIDMEDPEIYWLDVYSKKNKNSTNKERIAPPLYQAVYFLNELKKWQEKNGIKSPYVFPSSRDPNKFISSSTVNKWFFRLTKKVLGRSLHNYLLRHGKGEELHKLVRENKLSEDNAVQMMGHSKKMFNKTYSHANKKEVKKILKKQVLDINYIAPEKKHQLEKDVEQQKVEILELREKIDDINNFGAVASNLFEDKNLQKALLQSMRENGFGKQLMELYGKSEYYRGNK